MFVFYFLISFVYIYCFGHFDFSLFHVNPFSFSFICFPMWYPYFYVHPLPFSFYLSMCYSSFLISLQLYIYLFSCFYYSPSIVQLVVSFSYVLCVTALYNSHFSHTFVHSKPFFKNYCVDTWTIIF